VPALLPSKAQPPEAGEAAEVPVPARGCRAASAAWAAGSARQWAARAAAPREAEPQAVEHKPLITSTEAPAAARAWEAAQPRGRREAVPVAAPPKPPVEEKAPRQRERPAWLEEVPQRVVPARLSKAASQRKRNKR
jgi:hypothetical protein